MQRALPPASSIVGKREGKQAGEALDRSALFVAEMSFGPGREDEQFALFGMQLERIAGEVLDLVAGQRDDGLAGGLKPVRAPFRVARGRRSFRVQRGRSWWPRTA